MAFMRPKAPSTAAAPPPPVAEDTAAAQQDYADRLRQRRGRAASVLTKPGQQQPQTAAKQLLGQ